MSDAAGMAAIMMGGPLVIILALVLGGIAYALQPSMPEYDIQSIMILEVVAIAGIGVAIFGLLSLVGKK